MSNKRIDFTKLGGLGFTQDTLDFKQVGELAAWQAFAKGLGHQVIVWGVADQGASVSDGYVVIDGELLPFVGGAKLNKVYVEELTDVEVFADTSQPTVYFTKRARMGVTGAYNLADFRKWKSNSTSLDDGEVVATARAVKKLQDQVLAMLGFETTVILSGCAVSAVNTGASTLAISAGMVMIGGAIIASQAYTGAFPAYLKPDGTYTAVQPAGDFIAFNPHTSQRYADVLRRATTPVGEVKIFKTLSDRFDNAGLGRWEMKGFRLSDDMQSRVPLGYDRRQVDPNDNAWDAEHTNVGFANGKKKVQLQVAELPKHRFFILANVDSVVNGFPQPPSAINSIAKHYDKNDGTQGKESYFIAGVNTEPTLGQSSEVGGDQAHENRMPFRVVVYAERI